MEEKKKSIVFEVASELTLMLLLPFIIAVVRIIGFLKHSNNSYMNPYTAVYKDRPRRRKLPETTSPSPDPAAAKEE